MKPKFIIWGFVILLLILHQDNWFWNDDTLVFKFIPIGLFYHACISVAAGVVWYFATIYAWPLDLESSMDDQGDGNQNENKQGDRPA